jgi:hypothetical protein
MPVLLQVDPVLDLEILRERFGFEIVSEQEDGYVIVATEDLDLTALVRMIHDFARAAYGSATIASIHRLFDDPNQEERLRRVLSERLFAEWPTIADDRNYIVDVSVECLGPQEIPDPPERKDSQSDTDWASEQAAWSAARVAAYQAWDEVWSTREQEIERVIGFYSGRILNSVDNKPVDAVGTLDSFSLRIEVLGKGLRDLVLNYPYIFEVVEPENIELPQRVEPVVEAPKPDFQLLPPPEEAPAVCVIDSGMQEEHFLLEPAIDKPSSYCFVPDRPPNEIGDYVSPGGHGTRIGGAVLYGETVLRTGKVQLESWLQNARVLNKDLRLLTDLYPPAMIREVVERYHSGPRKTRLFNQSINYTIPCRLRHMSAWAAEMDRLSETHDILIIQSGGNLYCSEPGPLMGIRQHLQSGRDYPGYLAEASCRVADPAQSLQALTVGSVAYGSFEVPGWRSFAGDRGHPSAFSRTGFGIWNVIKPEVVEFGGDNLRTNNLPPDVATPSSGRPCYPELVRSTMFPPGPAVDRDEVGTSFAAPKVTRIAARLQAVLPNETCLLYRALIVQSARWPAWTSAATGPELTQILRYIGYGIPEIDRATTNTPHRVTFVASRNRKTGRELRIRARECHIFQIPIPREMRRQSDEYQILIEVTLSYAAQPRRIRRNLRRYLSTWLDWKSSNLGESIESLRNRALKDQDDSGMHAKGTPISWMLGTRSNSGNVKNAKRSAGTVQKDWAVAKSRNLPDDFGIAVVGHPGWSNDPDSSAKYALAVSFEVLGREIEIYQHMNIAVNELQAEIDAETEAEAEVQEEVEG